MAKNDPSVPRSDAQAETQIARIGVLDRAIDAAKVKRNEAVALLEAQLASETKTLVDEAARLREGLEEYAVANRARLTEGGKRKSAQFATGKISWMKRRTTVEIDGDEGDIVAAIRKRIDGLTHKIDAGAAPDRLTALVQERAALLAFIREKAELNQTALKDRPEVAGTIRGIRIVSADEKFTVAPLASQIREVA